MSKKISKITDDKLQELYDLALEALKDDLTSEELLKKGAAGYSVRQRTAFNIFALVNAKDIDELKNILKIEYVGTDESGEN